MKKTLLASALSAMLVAFPAAVCAASGISATLLATYSTELADVEEEVPSGETVALRDDRMYVTNADDVSLDIVDVSNPAAPRLVRRVDLKAYGAAVNSVDVSAKNLIAVAVDAPKKTDPGTVVFLTPGGQVIRTVQVGAGPDMVVFTPRGDRLLVANEGEPDCYGTGCTDPVGSVSVIDVIPMKPKLTVHTIDFGNAILPAGVRLFGPGATPAQDLEPEYIAVSDDGTTAWVTLQENNAIARLDLDSLSVSAIFPLGYKDHSLNGNGLDASDRDSVINIQSWGNVLGMYQPDAVAQFQANGRTWLISANEGDARDYNGFAEEVRARSAGTRVADAANNSKLGRLTVTNTPPGGDLNNLYVFGARSFSIWNADTGSLAWDSGDQLEQITAARLPTYFNSNNDENSFDNRSDNKGPEPEGVAVGRVGGKTYAFVGLERIGGVVVYDITDPQAPAFQDYLVTRDFTRPVSESDSGPEVVRFVDARISPTGIPMLLVANEISGTVNLWQLQPKP
jgi:DNA-binding beta-propeller fold protein YncE